MTKRSFSPEYKVKIVMEVLEGKHLAGEIAAENGINPKLLSSWKQEFLQNAHKAFSTSKEAAEAARQLMEAESREQELMAKIGVLTMENDWLKKNLRKSTDAKERTLMVEKGSGMAVSRQCELLGIHRSRFYYEPKMPSADEAEYFDLLRRMIDFWHTKHCYMGHRKIARKLKVEDGLKVGKKPVRA